MPKRIKKLGWLPYACITSGLAEDWWPLVKSDWINTGNFGFYIKHQRNGVQTP